MYPHSLLPLLQLFGQDLDLQLREPREVRQREEVIAAVQHKLLQRLQFAQPLRQRGQARRAPKLPVSVPSSICASSQAAKEKALYPLAFHGSRWSGRFSPFSCHFKSLP